MKDERKEHANYVHKVRENTRRYVEELLHENEKLQLRLSVLEQERCDLERQLLDAQARLDHQKLEAEKLKQRFSAIESEQRRFFDDYARVEAQNNNLSNLYVATYGLHGSLDRQEILSIIREIIVNLVGSEELAVFELTPDRTKLKLAVSMGIDSEPLQVIPLESGLIGRTARSGEPYLADRHDGDGALPHESTLTACVPLQVGDRVTGAIAVFRLLQQKPGLEPLDLELFDLLASQAGTALYCSELHERLSAESPATD